MYYFNCTKSGSVTLMFFQTGCIYLQRADQALVECVYKKEKKSVTFPASSRPRNTIICYLIHETWHKIEQPRDHLVLMVMLRWIRPSGHPPVGERQRHAKTRVFTLVAFVKV